MDMLSWAISGGGKGGTGDGGDKNDSAKEQEDYSSDSSTPDKSTSVAPAASAQINAFAAFDVDELRTKKWKMGVEINQLTTKVGRLAKTLSVARTFNLARWNFLMELQYKNRKLISIAEFQAVSARVIHRMEHYRLSKQLKAKKKTRKQLAAAIEEQRAQVGNEIDGVQDDMLNHSTQSQNSQ
jgi:hypothetical protein